MEEKVIIDQESSSRDLVVSVPIIVAVLGFIAGTLAFIFPTLKHHHSMAGTPTGTTIKRLAFVALIFLSAIESTNALELAEFDDKSANLAFTDENVGAARAFSNISLVITYTTVIVASLMLAGFLWMAFAYSGQAGSSGYGRKKREAFTYDQEMAAKLHWIKESFKKYEIEDLGCQLYIACEAGKIKDSKKKVGRMTTMIHSLISPIELKEVDKLPTDIKRLFLAYQEGSMLEESCASLYSAICPLITKKRIQ